MSTGSRMTHQLLLGLGSIVSNSLYFFPCSDDLLQNYTVRPFKLLQS